MWSGLDIETPIHLTCRSVGKGGGGGVDRIESRL